MRIEVKMLIVLIVLLLSVGPVEYFMMGGQKPAELELPENNQSNEPLMHNFGANLTGTIIEMQPYISYVGIAADNDKAYVEGVLRSIGVTNYSIDIVPSPLGEGYQFTIKVAVDQEHMKSVGFRMVFRLSKYFQQQALPSSVGKVLITPAVMQQVGNESVMLTSDNLTATALLLYSNSINSSVEVGCSDVIASLNWKLVKINKVCVDQGKQAYLYGLQLADMISSGTKNVIFEADIPTITTAEMHGTFPFGSVVTKTSLEGDAGKVPGVTNAEATVVAPETQVTLLGVNASLNLSGATTQVSGNDTVVSFNTTLQSVLDQVKDQLGYAPETILANGSFSLSLNFSDQSAPSGVKAKLEASGLAVSSAFKQADVSLPASLTADNETFELLYITSVPVKLKLDAVPGKVPLNITLTLKFDEVLNLNAEQS